MKHGGDQWSKSQEFLEEQAVEEGPVQKAAPHPHSRGLRGEGLVAFPAGR